MPGDEAGIRKEIRHHGKLRAYVGRRSPGSFAAEKDDPSFDVWWGGPVDSFVSAKAPGVLEAYNSPSFANLNDPELKKDDDTWAGIYMGSLGFATNTNWLKAHPDAKAPTSWDDLLKPEFKGQVIVAHPSTSGTSYTALSTILQIRGEAAGWEYIKKYAGQISRTPRPARPRPNWWHRAKARWPSCSRTIPSMRSKTTMLP